MASTEGQFPESREIRYEYSKDFGKILQEAGVSLLVSTYQAGKLVVLGADEQGPTISLHNFEQPMGIAVHPDRIAVGARTHICLLDNRPDLTEQLGSTAQYDSCYLAMRSHFTNDISIHELAWCGEELWFVNTRFSCLASLEPEYSFVPRWKPPFITELVAEDSCHLNGFCVENGQPRYVTMHAETELSGGWRETKTTGGSLVDVDSGNTILGDLAMPHSPRLHAGRLWLLESGKGLLLHVDRETGIAQQVTQQPGFTRGLAFSGKYAFIGLSLIRETAVFGEIPISEHPDELKCAVVAVDLETGQRVAYFEFLSGVEEIFDVQVLATSRNPYISGPMATVEGAKTIWYAAAPRWLEGEQSTADTRGSAVHASDDGIRLSRESAQIFQQGVQHLRQDRFAEAVVSFDQLIDVEPEFAPAYCNRGMAEQFMGRFEESTASLEKSLELGPEVATTHMNLAMTCFLEEDLQQGWREYKWRWQCERFESYPSGIGNLAPEWDGSSLEGKRILVFGEQGVGDEIMFASCLPEIIEQAGSCVIACCPRLVPLFRRSFPAAEVVSRFHMPVLEDLDVHVSAGETAGHLRKTLAAFPRLQQFLVPEAGLAVHWKSRLEELGDGKKVGISWRGGKDPEDRRRRSTMLSQWLPIAQQANVKLVNLQYGDCGSELQEAAQQGVKVHNFPEIDPLVDLDGLAALVGSLDLVISIDNSTIHLAGALGVPTLAMVSFPSMAYWRWFSDEADTVWYRSLELFRRNHSEDWDSIFDRVAERLEELN